MSFLQELTGTALNDRIVLAIGTITKMFVGELVETGEVVEMKCYCWEPECMDV